LLKTPDSSPCPAIPASECSAKCWAGVFGEHSEAGGGDVVAGEVFDQVHGFVGQVEQFGFGLGVARVGSDTEAGGDVNVEAVLAKPGRFTDQLVEATGDDAGIFLGGLRQHQDELIATVAESKVCQATPGLQRLANFRQQFAAGQVAMGVVDAFEVVQVNENQGKLVAVAARAVNFLFEDFVQVAGIVQTGAVVGDRQFVNALDMSRVFDGDGSIVGQRFQQGQVALLKPVRAHAVDQLDDAEGMVAKTDRYGDHRACFHSGFFIHLFEEARVLADIRDNGGLTGLRHPAGDALANFDAHVLQRLGALSRGDFKVQLLTRFIDEQQRPGIRTEEFVDFLHDGQQNLIELERAGQGFAEFVKDGDLAGLTGLSGAVGAGVPAAFDAEELFRVLQESPLLARNYALRAERRDRPPSHYREAFSPRATTGAAPVSHQSPPGSDGEGVDSARAAAYSRSAGAPRRGTSRLHPMAKGSFGETLKREREMRGVSLEEIAAATRISTRFLLALENEQWEKLPGGVFNRGFVRAVARYLGMDEEALIAEYALATRDQPQVAVWAEKAPAAKHARRWRLGALALLVLALAVAGGWLLWQRYAGQIRAWWSPPTPESQATPLVPAAEPSTPTAGAVERLELKIEAGRDTTVTVRADGQTLFEGALRVGQVQRFEAREQFQVTVRDPADVLLELNGQTLPPLGPPGASATATLTRADLKPTGGPN
jgi:transcriptional regulator with XRE-family HTH domain